MIGRSRHRDAVRILYILVAGSYASPTTSATGAAKIFRGEARLHALDFWVRNPDYLAEELAQLFEETKEPYWLSEAERIFHFEEPDIRRFPMIRYRFGAFERLDDTLALLTCRGLVKITGVKSAGKVKETDFLVMPSALDLAASIQKDFPGLSWYAERAALAAKVAGDKGGDALKKRQYQQAEYAETQLGGNIPAITERVRARLALLKNAV